MSSITHLQNMHMQQCPKNVSFGHKVVIDIGASDPRGSLKMVDQLDSGDVLVRNSEYVGKSKKGFDSEYAFLEAIAGHIQKISAQTIKRIDALKMEEPEKQREKKLSSIVLLIPCQVRNDIAQVFSNLRTKEGNKLSNIDLTQLPEILKTRGIELAENFKLISTNDMFGAGASIAKALANHPAYKDQFQEGFYATGIKPGGGFGIIDIKVKDDNKVEIEKVENGHNLAINSPSRIISKTGATGKTLLHNYAKALGFDDHLAEEVVKTGRADLITDGYATVNPMQDHEAIKALTKTGIYSIVKDKHGTHLKLNCHNLETTLKHFDAQKKAVEQFVNAIAQASIQKINSGVNLLVLAGPIASGVRDAVDNNPEQYNNKTLKELILDKLHNYIKTDQTTLDLKETYEFDIIFGDDINVKENTEGGRVLTDESTKVLGAGRRGNWIKFSIDALKRD